MTRFRQHAIKRHEVLDRISLYRDAEANREALASLTSDYVGELNAKDQQPAEDCPTPPPECVEEVDCVEKRKELQLLRAIHNGANERLKSWNSVEIFCCFKEAGLSDCWKCVSALLQYDRLLSNAHVKACAAELCALELMSVGCERQELLDAVYAVCGDRASWTGITGAYLNNAVEHQS